MTQLYHTSTTDPAPLPFRVRLSDGRTRTDPATFTEAEIADAGYIAAPEQPAHDPETQRVRWDQQAQDWAIEDLPQETLAEAKLRRHGEVHRQYSVVMGTIGDQYPPEEREGWAEQVQAARDVLAGGTSDLIDALRAPTGEAAIEMANAIMARRTQYVALYGAATGNRRSLDAQIAAATTLAEVEAVDLETGWPVG